MKKEFLNNYELAVLHRGAEEERNNGIQIHSYPKYETSGLLDEYHAWAQHNAKIDSQIVVGALRDLFQWWAVYFAVGEEAARAIQKEYNDEMIKQIEEIINANRVRRFIKEMEEISNA